MEPCLTILPSFKVVVDPSQEESYDLLLKIYGFFKIDLNSNRGVITDKSLWYGLNLYKETYTYNSFISILKEISTQIPENVLIELNNFNSKYGKITTLCEDCIYITDENVLKQISNSAILKQHITLQGNQGWLSNISTRKLNELLISELGYPLTTRYFNQEVYFFNVYEGFEKTISFLVKAPNLDAAYYELFYCKPNIGSLNFFTEDKAKQFNKLQGEDILTEEHIIKFMDHIKKKGNSIPGFKIEYMKLKNGVLQYNEHMTGLIKYIGDDFKEGD